MSTWQNKFKKSMAFATISVISILFSIPALAYDDEDEAIIEQNIATMMTSINSMDIKPILDMMPPNVLLNNAKTANKSVVELKETVIMLMDLLVQAMNYGEDSSINYIAYLDNARFMQTETGRDYVLIPSKLSVVNDGKGWNMTETLIALEDDDKWYMLRIEDQHHLNMLEEAYPDMTNIEIFEPTMEEFEVLSDADATVSL